MPGERDEHVVDNTFHPRTNFIPTHFIPNWFVCLFVWLRNDDWGYLLEHPILVLRKQTCVCPASGMSTRLTTPFILGQILSQEIFHPELILLVSLYGWLHIMSILYTCLKKANNRPASRMSTRLQHLSYQYILSHTDLLFVCLYGCIMMIEETCWNTQYLSCESTLCVCVFFLFVFFVSFCSSYEGYQCTFSKVHQMSV